MLEHAYRNGIRRPRVTADSACPLGNFLNGCLPCAPPLGKDDRRRQVYFAESLAPSLLTVGGKSLISSSWISTPIGDQFADSPGIAGSS